MHRNSLMTTPERQHQDRDRSSAGTLEEIPLRRSIARLGFWSALVVVLGGILYLIVTAGNLVLGFSYPPVEIIQTLAGISTLLMAPSLIVLMACVHAYTSPDKRVLSQLGYTLMVVFAVLASINRFLQFTVLHQVSSNGLTDELTAFVIYHNPSIALALEMLSWGFCLGLALLLTAPVFSGGSLERGLRALFITAGLLCIGCGIGYVLANHLGAISPVFGMAGMGLGVLAWSIVLPFAAALLAVLFKRAEHLARS